MKPINFIKPITPQEHRSLIFWYRASIIMLLALMLGIVSVHIKQMLDMRQLNHQKSMLMPHSYTVGIEQNKQDLAEEEKTLKSRLEAVKAWSAHQQQSITILKAINSAVAQAHMHLLSITLNNHQLELVAQCTEPQAAVQLAQLLSNSPQLRSVKLASLQPNKIAQAHGYRVTINGRIQST